MEIYNSLAEITKPFPDSFVTIGNFDGVHLGHHMLFSEVVSRAYQKQGTSVVITFEPHPMQVVRPEIGIKLISTYEQKVELISLASTFLWSSPLPGILLQPVRKPLWMKC